MNFLRVFALPLSITLNSFAGTFYWTGGGDGVSLYQDANCAANQDGSGATIGAINPNSPVNHGLIAKTGHPVSILGRVL